MEFPPDLFDAATGLRLVAHYETRLAGLAADPERRLGALPLLGPAERHQLLAAWNDTREDWAEAPHGACLHRLVEAQVERTPRAVAVVCEGAALSYRELDRRADRLARRLRRLGVGPEVLVGVCAERSLELIVGLLAILKAGGAYVPFDPGDPPARLASMLADSGVPLVLVQPALPARLAPLAGRGGRGPPPGPSGAAAGGGAPGDGGGGGPPGQGLPRRDDRARRDHDPALRAFDAAGVPRGAGAVALHQPAAGDGFGRGAAARARAAVPGASGRAVG